MDWKAIKTEYITTDISYRKLSVKWGVPFNTLQCRARKEKWVDAKRKHQDKIVAKMVDKAENAVIDYKSKLYAIAYNVANQLEALTRDISIKELLAVGIKVRDITGAIKDLEDSLHIKSESDIKEQEARIRSLQKQAEKDEIGSKDVTVTIEGGDPSWQS